MKRKAPSTEFKPPQQRLVKIAVTQPSSVISKEPERASLQCTESTVEKYLDTNEHEMDLSLVEVPSNVEHASMIIPESEDDIKYKPWSESAMEYESDGTCTEETEKSQSPRYALDETGEDDPCGDFEESKIKVLDPGALEVLLGEKSCNPDETQLQATDETESVKPPTKRRLRRRMGMYGHGYRKRKALVEGQHSRVNRRKKAEGGESADKESRDVLRVSSMMENKDEGTTEQVVVQQDPNLQPMISGQDQPSRAAVTHEHDMEMATSYNGPKLAMNGDLDMEVTLKNDKCLLEDKWDAEVSDGTHAIAEDMIESPVAEDISHGSTVAVEVCEGSEETECPVEIVENMSFGATGLTNEVSEDFEKSAAHAVTDAVSFDLLGVSNEVCESSKDPRIQTSECPVEVFEEVSSGAIDPTNEMYRSCKETSEVDSEEVSCGAVGLSDEVPEGSKETSEHLTEISEEVSCGAVGLSDDVPEGSKETSELLTEVAEEVTCGAAGLSNEVPEGSKETPEHLTEISEEVSCGAFGHSDEVPEGCKNTSERPTEVAEEVSCGAVGHSDVHEGSKETFEHPIAAKVSYSSDITGEVCQGYKASAQDQGAAEDAVSYEFVYETFKETSEDPVAARVSYSSAGVELSEGCKGVSGDPVDVVEEDYGSTGTNDVHKKEATELLVGDAEELKNRFTDVDNEICEDPEEPADLSEAFNTGSMYVTEVCGGSEEPSQGEVVAPTEVNYSSVAVIMEVQESIIALEQSDMETCSPHVATRLAAVSEHDRNGPHLSMEADPEMKGTFVENMVTAETPPPEMHDDKSPFEGTELIPVSTGPGVTVELSVCTAPPTGQEEDIHCPSVIPAVVGQAECNSTMTPAATELPQDHDGVPLSLYSVTDSQLNNIAMSMELDGHPVPEDFVHQEDATEFVCGLIKELSSLNRTVMVAHREMEVMRRGSRAPKTQISRSYGVRTAEI